MHTLHLHRSEDDGKNEKGLNHGRYRTEIKGYGDHERSAPGILKTVDFRVLNVTS